mmetsp:Transcript_27454/g.33556  ORF Transcript_27454/g.33556 Transcript_27454/m.33556 type:complete len:152 (+) Transcript_27454:172-627(+)
MAVGTRERSSSHSSSASSVGAGLGLGRLRASSFQQFNPGSDRLHRTKSGRIPSTRLSRRLSFRDQDPKDVEVSAREAVDQMKLPSTGMAIALTGGVANTKEGFLQVRTTGSVSWMTGWKRKYCKLENGKIKFFDPKEIDKFGVEVIENASA